MHKKSDKINTLKGAKEISIIFMGTPEFAVVILDKLIREEYNVKAVVTTPNRPAGRGQKIHTSSIKEYADSNQLPILQPENLKDDAFIRDLEKFEAELFIVVAFRMLPKKVWSIPKLGTFNLHGSLLPKYRGAAPINWAIINGETKTGVTTFFIDEKIDTGKIILQEELAIRENETAGELHDKMALLGANVVVNTVDLIASGEITATPQPKVAPLPAPKIFKQDCFVNLKQPIDKVHNFIRGLSPYPTAWIKIRHKENDSIKTIKLFEVYILSREKSTNIQFINEGKQLHLQLFDGTLAIKTLQLEGKRKLSVQDFLAGFKIEDWEIIA